jgi:predicted kinase
MGRATLLLVTGPPGTGKSTLAEAAAQSLGASVLAWDWAMAALTQFEPIQVALRGLDPVVHRHVGWSILRHLAIAQLRQGRGVVLAVRPGRTRFRPPGTSPGMWGRAAWWS